MASALSIQGLCKAYDAHQALSDITMHVSSGERVALLGHNGAGKSTLMKLVLGLSTPTSGKIVVFGAAPGTSAARHATAYLPEAVAFHRALTGREQLNLFARLSGTPQRDVPALLDRVGLGDAADRRIGTWSKGMRQRLGLAQVLLGRPRVALLDEPTSGLDPISRGDLYAIIDEMAARGSAVVIASHALTEVEARTDRIAILRKGRLIANDALTDLRAQANLPIRFRLTAATGNATVIHDRIGGQRINGASVELACQAHEKMKILSSAASLGREISDIEIIEPSLEDLYRYFSGETLT